MDGLTPSSTEYLVLSTTSTLSLAASDPSFPGAPVSGVVDTLVLLDAPFVDTVSTPGQPYAGPFILSAGSHTLVYYSRDIAGNVETARGVSVLVDEPLPRTGTLGIGRDSADRLWTVVVNGTELALAKADVNAVVLASASLAQASVNARWNVLFDGSGGAYAVGTAEGIGADLAVYKASVDGDAIISTRIFDSGFGGDDQVFAAAAPGWIVGSVQVLGDSKAALWRFNPEDMTVALSTTFSSGVALGVAVDADGSAWVAGYLTNPAPRSSRGFDLGLWHFAADGQTLLAGPFRREAYASGFSSTFAAAISIASAAVTVTVPRGRTGGGTDLGSVRFDKASGAVLAEHAWRATDGSSAYPAAALPDGEGFLAAGGLDSGTTRAALWRYGADGGLTSASLAAAGGARGAAFRGSELWLAVDDATSPYKVTNENALSGSLADVQPPRVELSAAGPMFVAGGEVFVGPTSELAFVVTDDKLAFGDGLGGGAPSAYYRVDSTGSFTAFSSSFSVAAGTAHLIDFYAMDAADNPGSISSRTVIVDPEPPVTQLSQNGAEITLEASDSNGAGVFRIHYLVDYLDPDVCNNVAEDTAAARGTCENPWYAGPFMLSNGGHVVRFRAFDNVGNAEQAQTVFPNVGFSDDEDDPGGLGIGRDPFDAFWTVNAEPDAIAFTRSDSSGAPLASSPLEDGVDDMPWSVFFDASGRAYAIGMAHPEPESEVLDLAIYKASPSGDAIETRTLFDSGYANNELVFDAKAPGWIVGGAQTAGPPDLDEDGDRSFSLALWRFDPVSGAVELSTSVSRAGFDFGTGLAVDADGSLWIVGYSAQPDAPDEGGLDLALRHYASDGQTLLGGPFFKPGYLSHLDGGITAKVHVTNDAVFVAAPRLNASVDSDGSDTAFLKFDKATGQTLVEKVWRAPGGTRSYPVAILPEAGGLLIAGAIGEDMTDAALWRFGYDGAFLGATTADAGGAQGAVFKGSELWLSVDGSTSPYRVTSETPVVGSFIDVSTPAAGGVAVAPSTGPIGIPFTVAGAGFGPYGGSNTRIKFGTLAAPVSVWNDTTIKGTIPGLSTGVYAVAIERQNVSSLTVTSAGLFTVTDLNTAVLNISSGPIGVPFSIAGTGFGPYAGALSRVLLGGATAPLSVWNDTTISGTLPAVPPGETTILIQRATADGGLSTSEGFAFEVTVPSVTSVSPSSAPIGAVYTLTGFSCGPYAGSNSRVLFGGASTALSLWSDRVIKGTVPGALSPGVQTVIVERLTAGGGLVQSGTAYFQVAGLALAGIVPSSAPIGVPFTISGSGFGVFDGANTRVKFGVSTAAVSLWNDTTITGTIPALEPGEWPVVVERQQGSAVSASLTTTFTATALSVNAISPSSGPIGTAFTLTGPGFGPYAGAASVVLIDGATAALSVWNDASIVGTIPGSVSTGTRPVVLRRTSGTGESISPPVYFEVTVPAVAGIIPSSAPIGAPFTITGTNFGVFGGANTRVTFNGVIAALSLWNDTTITGTVPAVPAGIVDIIVERQQGADVSASVAVPFTVLDPAVGGVSPGSGPIGTIFTITGNGFGPYAGANTRVLIGGTTAALSLWNDTTIKGTIPALPPGVVPVWLERSAGSGVSSSATSYFNVTTPEVATLTPSSAPIGAPFTITGTSFGAYAGANTRVTFNGVIAPLSVWNDIQITGTVPGSLEPGEAVLVVERAFGTGLSASATQAFFVLAPSISTISPSYGPVGTVVTVNGSGFGPYSGTLTKLLVGGATVPLSVWNDTTIRWTVPASLGDGEYPVVVERSPAGGTVVSASATFTVGTGYSGASFGFTETLSLAATPDTHFEGDMSLSSAAGGRIDTPAKAAVEIPPNAMEQDTAITLKRIRSDGLRASAAEEIKMRPAGEPIEFGPPGTRFATPVTIELPYDPALTGDETKIAVHYYNPLRREWEALPSVVDRARKVVTAKTDHFSIYQPLGLAPTTVAQDEFYFRDAYAFPNPSRGGALVTFRIQPGLAETVELRVYDLSGRRIHSSSDFTFRGAIDDGNGKGAQNTYDHVWNVSGVGSGVYNFVIKASQRGHKPITKNGKVGVIR
ncbi:MAG: IPT/TIG domain-containing protein [Elusimicrobiota bacterium]|nr:IPT/TIG domain-containing protein [Elusimicrobiota bacterium]